MVEPFLYQVITVTLIVMTRVNSSEALVNLWIRRDLNIFVMIFRNEVLWLSLKCLNYNHSNFGFQVGLSTSSTLENFARKNNPRIDKFSNNLKQVKFHLLLWQYFWNFYLTYPTNMWHLYELSNKGRLWHRDIVSTMLNSIITGIKLNECFSEPGFVAIKRH